MVTKNAVFMRSVAFRKRLIYKTVKEEEPKHAVPPLLFFKTSITLRAKIKQGKLIGFRHIAKQSQITHQFYCCL